MAKVTNLGIREFFEESSIGLFIGEGYNAFIWDSIWIEFRVPVGRLPEFSVACRVWRDRIENLDYDLGRFFCRRIFIRGAHEEPTQEEADDEGEGCNKNPG